MKPTSKDIKIALLAWLRFSKRMSAVATEAGPWAADVLGVSPKASIEVEVKTSLPDLKRDFDKGKHWVYKNSVGSSGVPNYFYFAVPKGMVPAASGILKEQMPKAGLLEYSGIKTFDPTDCLKVVKKPTKLHEGLPKASLMHSVTNRMASELVTLYVALENTKLNTQEFCELREVVASSARKYSLALDIEDPLGDITDRAIELSAAGGLDWDILPSSERDNWKVMVNRLLESNSKTWAIA